MTRSLGLVLAASAMFSGLAHASCAKSRSAPTTTTNSATTVDAATDLDTTTTVSNTTSTLNPIPAPNVDISNPIQISPSQNVSLYYGLNSTADPSVVNITLSMNHPAVTLENIQSVIGVDCSNDSVAVTFEDADSFNDALQQWTLNGNLIMITNHMGDCDAEFERGFFLVDSIAANTTNTIVATASKQQLDSIAHTGEFAFSALPAAALSKRLTLSPSTALTFSDSLSKDTVLLDVSPYVEIVADNASFSATVTFSGYLHYNFWTFSLTDLYFDLDTTFDAELDLSLGVGAAYSTSLSYAPDALSYSLVSVPGIISLGPGIAFAVGVNLNASAAVNVTTGASVSLADGNVHIDVVDSSNTNATGWTPTYSGYANITEQAEINVDPYVSVSVELAFELLGGLVDLSTGVTATPGFTNQFTLTAAETGEVSNSTASGSLPAGTGCSQGIELETDFVFNVTAFATEWWSATLYNVDVPLWDYCYSWA